MHPSNKVTLENVKDVVRYHRPTADQSRRHEALSLATEHFIVALLENCPDCADRSAAVRHARDAKMTASAAIALEDGHEVAGESGGTAQGSAPSAGPSATVAPSPSSGLKPGEPGAAVVQRPPDVAPTGPAAPAEVPPEPASSIAPGAAVTSPGDAPK